MSRVRKRIPFHQIRKQGMGNKNILSFQSIQELEKATHRKTFNPRYMAFKERTKNRDQHQCVICGDKKDLVVAHIEKYSDNPIRRCDVNNALTLCKSCENRFNQEYPLQRPHDMFCYIRKYSGLKLMYTVLNRYNIGYIKSIPIVMKYPGSIKGVTA